MLLADSCQIVQHNALISLQAICRFGLATSFPAGHEVSFAELAAASGLQEPLIRRIVRHAAAHHVFRESRRGFIVHTAASKVLSVDPQMRQWVGMVTEEMWPAAAKVCANFDSCDTADVDLQAVEALAVWPGSQEPTHTVRIGAVSNCSGMSR